MQDYHTTSIAGNEKSFSSARDFLSSIDRMQKFFSSARGFLSSIGKAQKLFNLARGQFIRFSEGKCSPVLLCTALYPRLFYKKGYGAPPHGY